MNFTDLKFEPIKIDVMWLALQSSGMGMGTKRALLSINNYTLSVIQGSYLCTEGTYEVGILNKDGVLMGIETHPELNQEIVTLGIETDGSGHLVYKEVSPENVEKIMNILEEKKDDNR